jgi:hypothetical protein
MPSERVFELAEQYETLVLADTITHRALVALYVDMLGIGGALSDEEMQEVINAFIREACTEPMLGLGWLYYACGQKTLGGAPAEDIGDADEKNFNTLMVIFAVNAIHGFPENIEDQEALFEKVHEGIKASIEIAGEVIVEAAIEDLKDILIDSSKEELASLCRDRGMAEEEIVATFDSLQAVFATESAANWPMN